MTEPYPLRWWQHLLGEIDEICDHDYQLEDEGAGVYLWRCSRPGCGHLADTATVMEYRKRRDNPSPQR